MESSSQLRRRHLPPSGNEVTQDVHATAQKSVKPNSGLMSALRWTGLLGFIASVFFIGHFISEILPRPLSASEAGKFRFSEQRALAHLSTLTQFGPRPVGSDGLDHAMEYILYELKKVQMAAGPNVLVEIDYFHSKPGCNTLKKGLFSGKSLAYANLDHLVVRVSEKDSEDAEDNAFLISSHVDTVFTSAGAGDCGSCISVMLELVRVVSHSTKGFKHSIIFLFNTGEEEGLDGAHSFITQHAWNQSIFGFVDLEAMGISGKSSIFQAGPRKWLLEVFSKVAAHPSGQILAQDVFHSGIIKSATDFQVYMEIAGLSGLDFAYTDNGHVYHTRNDKLSLLEPGSLQHLGDNILPFVKEVAKLSDLDTTKAADWNKTEMVYFDILGLKMVTYSREIGKWIDNSIILQALVLLVSSLLLQGRKHFLIFLVGLLGVTLSGILAITFAVGMSVLVTFIGKQKVPYLPYPSLTLSLFGSPTLFGAVLGHFLGRKLMVRCLHSSNMNFQQASKIIDANKEEALVEKIYYKATFTQWLFILALATWVGAGSSYIALCWLVFPAIAYGLLETRLFIKQSFGGLHAQTLVVGLVVPILVCVPPFIRLPATLVASLVRIDRNPGEFSVYLANMLTAVVISALLYLSVTYLLPYVHKAGGAKWIMLGTALLSGISLCFIGFEVFPEFTGDVSRVLNVVHVIQTDSPAESYIHISSATPGDLGRDFLQNDSFLCTHNEILDLVTFSVKHGCKKHIEMKDSLWETRPSMKVNDDKISNEQRITSVVLKAEAARRWTLAINTGKIRAFNLDIMYKDLGIREPLVSRMDCDGLGGWHMVQFVSGKDGPDEFILDLFWIEEKERAKITDTKQAEPLLKLRTDVSLLTTELQKALDNLPSWCVVFAKSTSPLYLSYLTTLNLGG